LLCDCFADALAVTQYLKSKSLTGVQGFVSLLLLFSCIYTLFLVYIMCNLQASVLFMLSVITVIIILIIQGSETRVDTPKNPAGFFRVNPP